MVYAHHNETDLMLIAQISDIHASPTNDSIARLDRVMSWLAVLQPDLLVVSGDLIDGNWPEGYGLISASLHRLACRSLILPGNSDDRAVMRAIMPQAEHWHDRSAMHFIEPYGGALMIGLDTCVDGEAYGDVTQHLSWLRQALAGSSDSTSLLFTHHHVFPCGISVLDAVMCKGTRALADLLASGIKPPAAICSGHVHRSMSSLFAGIPAHICGSVCPANPLMLDASRTPPAMDPPALMIHDLRHAHLVSGHVSV
ncbi:phosphodiesterase [Rhizobium miluonense]|uniref:3',5'-cyclic AMP phosphodiesterase CpdA n=1 Tax=Rhizobium miluonense TaxID=411945 RepID=A0ABU1SUB4_9HYPH|nr:phosphodiesterase [Rhizobium miluonense]MDR6902555.1 3',5'-cyclic AMP phosphodiesterase CpdA [Rhizobium miluonense]